MSNDSWDMTSDDEVGMDDPWDLDMNSNDLCERNMLLPEPVLKVKLQVIAVDDHKKQNDPSPKPCKRITFKIIEGDFQDYVITDFFYGTQEARWRLRDLYIACGYGYKVNVEKNGIYKEEIHVDRSKRPHHCIGQCLVADCVDSGNPDKFYARIDNMRANV